MCVKFGQTNLGEIWSKFFFVANFDSQEPVKENQWHYNKSPSYFYNKGGVKKIMSLYPHFVNKGGGTVCQFRG
jgi:hypothetical protein